MFRAAFATLLLTGWSLIAVASQQTLLLTGGATERVVVAHDPRLNPTNAVTIEAWIRPSTLADCQTIVGKRLADGYWLGICNGVIWHYANGGDTFFTGRKSVEVATWSHIAVTWDGRSRRFYINGELDTSTITTEPLPNNDAPLGIGGEGASDSYPEGLFPFSGYLSEVRLWNRARSEAQIRESMYQQITEPTTGLVSVWSLEGTPGDRFGDFTSTLTDGAEFTELDSPPLPFDPLVIRSVADVVADGSCSDPNYANARVMPMWYPEADWVQGQDNPVPVWLGADREYLYICLPSRVALNDAFYTVEVDPGNDAGAALASDDWRFRLWPTNGGLQSFRGRAPSGPFGASEWIETSDPVGLSAQTDGFEFEINMEMRIPRDILPSAPDPFRIRVMHSYLDGASSEQRIAWPYQSSSTSPTSWRQAAINTNTGTLGAADGINPKLIDVGVGGRFNLSPSEVHLYARAQDQFGDLELVEMLVDGNVVQSDSLTGDDDTSHLLTHRGSYSVGIHTFRARAIDQAGRSVTSAPQTFQILVDGEAPSIDITIDPPNPGLGETVTISARATDPSGIRAIVMSDALGQTFPGPRCDFVDQVQQRTCRWTVTPATGGRKFHVRVRATDTEGFVNVAESIVLFGNTGLDSDDDGIVDAIEQSLCTDPNSPDTDLDGLSDGWEVNGIQFANGESEPLVTYGVHPCRKDLLLQIDFEEGAEPEPSSFQLLRSTLRDQGIKLYLETNNRPRPTVYGQSHLQDYTAVYQRQDGEYYFDPKRTWSFLYAYNVRATGTSGGGNRFSTIRPYVGSHGYCRNGSQPGKQCSADFACPGIGATCEAGCSGGLNSRRACADDSDCPTISGGFATCAVPCMTNFREGQPLCHKASSFSHSHLILHEVGHTAGLGHGGPLPRPAPRAEGGFVLPGGARWDAINYKPNYVSAMNYLYSAGKLCMEPIPDPMPEDYQPRFVADLSFSTDDLGDLNENALSESPASDFAERVRAQSCSHAENPDAIPVFKYSCTTSTGPVDIVSDGLRTVAVRLENWTWDLSPPQHAPGIDWNCDGIISVTPVAQSINQDNVRGILKGFNDHLSIPSVVDCQVHYRSNCREPERSCYTWPADYENAIPPLASGVNPLDCREWFLENQDWCPAGISDERFGTGRCPVVDRDSANAKTADRVAATKGDAPPELDQTEYEEGELPPQLPGVEICDLQDNDEDGTIDEGCTDSDADGIADPVDNCETWANPDQADRDDDGLGDVCQSPSVSGLSANEGDLQTVTLTWNRDAIPNLGYSVYRYSQHDPDIVYLGADYPTSMDARWSDHVPAGGIYTYVVRPLNLNGDEGEPVSTSIEVEASDLLFSDGFE